MKKRILYLDVLRIFAALMVVMIHVSAQYVNNMSNNLTDFMIGNVFDSLSRVAVPIFAMISGAVMLDESKQYSTKDFLKK